VHSHIKIKVNLIINNYSQMFNYMLNDFDGGNLLKLSISETKSY